MSSNYLEITVDGICQDIEDHFKEEELVEIQNLKLLIQPHVYPSHLFRTPWFIVNSLKESFDGATVCDMGCGPGTIGLFALQFGAKKVVQADINPYAVENAKANRSYHEITKEKLDIYESDCFSNIPTQPFDIIVFNAPFHPDDVVISDPLQKAFYDPHFETLRTFLTALPQYTKAGSEVIIAYTNRINTIDVENIFKEYNLNWELWKVQNSDTKYDNRLYKITF
jgi:methylase of polypeptide subunit release factors